MPNITNLFSNFLTGLVSFGNDILVPVLFTIGLVFFLYGLFNYFILGSGDEDKKEEGRGQLMNGNVGFVIGLVVWGVFQALIWLNGLDSPANIDINIEQKDGVQGIPNTPLR